MSKAKKLQIVDCHLNPNYRLKITFKSPISNFFIFFINFFSESNRQLWTLGSNLFLIVLR